MMEQVGHSLGWHLLDCSYMSSHHMPEGGRSYVKRLSCPCHECQAVKKEAQQFFHVIWVEQAHSPISGSTPLEHIWFRIEVFSLGISVGMDNWNDPIVG